MLVLRHCYFKSTKLLNELPCTKLQGNQVYSQTNFNNTVSLEEDHEFVENFFMKMAHHFLFHKC